jgi:hypothetical protein
MAVELGTRTKQPRKTHPQAPAARNPEEAQSVRPTRASSFLPA